MRRTCMQRPCAQCNLTETHAVYFEVGMLVSQSEHFGSPKGCASLWFSPFLEEKGQNILKNATQAVFQAHPSAWVSCRAALSGWKSCV